MLATLSHRVFSADGWLFEGKLDGVRALCSAGGDGIRLWTRNRKPLERTYPELVEALEAENAGDFVADGEVVAFEGPRTSFEKLQPRINLTDRSSIRASGITVYYYLFDLLRHDGEDLTRRPLRERKRLLARAFSFRDPLRLAEHRNRDGEVFYRQACARGWEGLIAKRAEGVYRGGRTSEWLKFKCVQEQEFVVGGFTEPAGSRVGFGALLLGYYEGSALRYAGKVGTGYDEETLRTLRGRLEGLRQNASPFAERVSERRSHWVSPELVVEIGFTEWTADGKLRHPRYTGLRRDKAVAEVARESR